MVTYALMLAGGGLHLSALLSRSARNAPRAQRKPLPARASRQPPSPPRTFRARRPVNLRSHASSERFPRRGSGRCLGRQPLRSSRWQPQTNSIISTKKIAPPSGAKSLVAVITQGSCPGRRGRATQWISKSTAGVIAGSVVWAIALARRRVWPTEANLPSNPCGSRYADFSGSL